MYRRLLQFLTIVIMVALLNCYFASEAKAEERLYYIHSDHLGSTTLVTDEQGNVVSQQSYFPYGETRSSQLPITSYPITERQYTSQVSDVSQTGLYYYNARYYNPQIAKFTQADTVEGPNRYAYVGNNPIIFTDPTGNQEFGFSYVPEKSTPELNSTSMYESADEVRRREEIMRRYNVNIPGSRMQDPYFLNTTTRVQWNLSEYNYVSLEELDMLDTALAKLDRSVYEGVSIYLTAEEIVGGGYTGSNYIVIDSNVNDLRTVAVHEITHFKQSRDPEFMDRFIQLAIDAGYEEGEFSIGGRSLSGIYNENLSASVIPGNLMLKDEMCSFSITDEGLLFTNVNYYELMANLTEHVSGFWGEESANMIKEYLPEIYKLLQKEIFGIEE